MGSLLSKIADPHVRYELARGRMQPGTPWCVQCNSRADEGCHEQCLTQMDSALWTPCLSCLGGGVAGDDGRSCPDCAGLGFWEINSPMAMLGGYTVIAEAYANCLPDSDEAGDQP